jgi:Protein of unknown function (DUF2798)
MNRQVVAHAFLMTGVLAFVLSGLLTALNAGLTSGFAHAWLRNDLTAWLVAFPLVVVLGPWLRTVVMRWVG